MDEMDYPDFELINYVVIMVTASGQEEGVKIARTLVEEKIVACVNLVDGVRSVFRWKGKVEEESECLLIIKTRGQQVPAVIQRVKALHSYDVPEVIVLPILDGNPSYLQWIDEVT